MFCCTLIPKIKLVTGDMNLGIILLVFKGKNIFGMDNFMSAPISEILKNRSLTSTASADDPTLPLPDISKICGQAWQAEGDIIYFLGNLSRKLDASEYLAAVHQTVAGKPPKIDFDLERTVQSVCRHGIRHDWLRSAHD